MLAALIISGLAGVILTVAGATYYAKRDLRECRKNMHREVLFCKIQQYGREL